MRSVRFDAGPVTLRIHEGGWVIHPHIELVRRDADLEFPVLIVLATGEGDVLDAAFPAQTLPPPALRTQGTEAVLVQQGFALTPFPPVVTGWQLQLHKDGAEVECTPFAMECFEDAQHACCAWLAQRGVESISRCFVRSHQASRRIGWEDDYRRKIDQRGF